ncbi:MAG: hypothetical protein GX326_05495 [Clostridiaceae bacterium]|nr:hypothetical protein [Clostridiaceae bacterium]
MENKKKNKTTSEFDDGRVYADMSVLDDIAPKISLKPKSKKKNVPLDAQGFPIEETSKPIELTKEEKREIAKGVIKAHLLYALLGLVLILFVFLFIFKIWLN